MRRDVQPTGGAIRVANRTSVVDVLRRSGSATRAELVSRTGLSRATVSSLVNDLRMCGVVSEQRETAHDSPGRPSARITLNRSAGLAIAVDVGVRHLAVAVGDLARRVLAERWVSLERGHRPRDGMEILLRCIDETIAEVDADREHVVGAAISIAAPIAPVSGRLLVPGVLPGWNSRDLADAVGRRWQVPVTVDNDANLGALAESIWGECAGSPSLLYVKAASRVGLGIALNGSVYRGNDGCAGEFGHLPMRSGGATCWCGRRGCLELYAGADGMLRQLAAGTGNAPTDVAALTARALAGDPEVIAVVRSSARMLARGMATLALLFNPTAIVIGGELARLGELLLTPARSELATLDFAPEVTVLQSSLGDRASLLGALALVLGETERFTDRSSAST